MVNITAACSLLVWLMHVLLTSQWPAHLHTVVIDPRRVFTLSRGQYTHKNSGSHVGPSNANFSRPHQILVAQLIVY